MKTGNTNSNMSHGREMNSDAELNVPDRPRSSPDKKAGTMKTISKARTMKGVNWLAWSELVRRSRGKMSRPIGGGAPAGRGCCPENSPIARLPCAPERQRRDGEEPHYEAQRERRYQQSRAEPLPACPFAGGRPLDAGQQEIIVPHAILQSARIILLRR